MKNIDDKAYISSSAKIDDSVKIIGNSYIGENVIIEGCSKIVNSKIEEGSIIKNSVIEDSEISKNCEIGNFSYIHTNSKIDKNVVIGHSVEVKKSKVGKNTKIKHLSYIGDAQIGENVNIGATTVFANYDGKNKNESQVENDVFIGSGTIIVSPVKIKKGSYIAAGSVITADVEENDLAIGRARQINKSGYFNNKNE